MRGRSPMQRRPLRSFWMFATGDVCLDGSAWFPSGKTFTTPSGQWLPLIPAAFGQLMFPTGLGCSTANGWPHVPIQANASPAIENWFQSNEALRRCDTAHLDTRVDCRKRYRGLSESGTRYLIVMTEGLDRCSCDDDPDDFRNESYENCLVEKLGRVTQSLVAKKGISVYVIGYKFLESRDVLNVIASNGNTDFDEFIFAGNEDTLTNAFESVIFDVKRCL